MSHMHITITGNLIFDPEMLRFDSDKFLTKFRVASSRRYRTGELDENNKPIWQETDVLYIDVECWGQLAINAGASLFKGAPVIVTGSLVTDSWVDNSQLDENGKPAARQKQVLRAAKVAFELSNHQLSSQRTSQQAFTPSGMEPVTVRGPEDLVEEKTPVRASAEDMVQANRAGSERDLSFADASTGGAEAPF